MAIFLAFEISHQFIAITPPDTMYYLSVRILVDNLEEFEGKASEVVWHIPSKFTKEMAMPSEVVSLFMTFMTSFFTFVYCGCDDLMCS